MQQAQELSANNSLKEAKALRKEAEEFKDQVCLYVLFNLPVGTL
jgi:hypothetical protein